MPPRLENRFNMLISVVVDAKGLEKLAPHFKRVALDARGFAKALSEQGVDLDRAKRLLKAYEKDIRSLASSKEKLAGLVEKESLVHEKQMQIIRSSKKHVSELTREHRELERYLKKGAVTAATMSASQKKLTAAVEKHALTEKKAKEAIRKATSARVTEGKEINKLIQSVTRGDKSMVRWTKKYEKLWIGTKKLNRTLDATTKAVRSVSTAIRKAERVTDRGSKSQGRLQKEMKRTEHATRRARIEFGKWSDQRLSPGMHGITVFRKSLGAIRNQILVLMFATRALRAIFSETFAASREMEAALKGLGSVAVNTGESLKGARDAALGLAEKGLITVRDAAAGLKNLLSAGFGLQESIQLMNALTDAASFNRQGTLELGAAIVGATQGIKNQNSIMVDNAGITKNLSIMYKEYAARIGTTIGKLNEAQKRQAIFNGVLREASIFAGDSEKVLSTMEGSLAKLGTQAFMAAAKIGDILKPAITGVVKVVSEGYEVIARFFSDETFKAKAVKEMAGVGEALGQVMRTLAGVITGVGKAISAITGGAGFLGMAGAALKVIAILRIKSSVMGRVSVATAAAVKVGKEYVLMSDRWTRKTMLVNRETGATIKGLKALKIQYRLIRMEMVKNLSHAKIATASLVGMERVGAKLGLTLEKLKIRFTAAGVAIKAFGGAVRVTKMIVMGFISTLGRLVVAFAAFEAIAIVWNLVFGAGAREKARIRLIREQEEALATLEKRYKSLRISISAATSGAGGLGIDIGGLSFAAADVKARMIAIRNLTEKIGKETSEKERERLRDLSEAHRNALEEEINTLSEHQQTVLRKSQEFYNRRAAIDQSYLETRTKFLKKYNLANLYTAEAYYQRLLTQQRDFNKWRGSLDDDLARDLQTQQDRINKAVIDAATLRSAEIQKLSQGLAQKVESIFDRLGSITARGAESVWEKAERQVQIIKDRTVGELEGMLRSVEGLMKSYENIFKERSENAKQAFIQSLTDMQRMSKTLEVAGVPQAGEARGLVGGLLGAVEVGDIDKIRAALDRFRVSTANVTVAIGEIGKMTPEAARGIQSMVNSSLAAVDAFDKWMAEETSFKNLTAETRTEISLITAQIRDKISASQDLINQYEKALLSLTAYNEALRDHVVLQGQIQIKDQVKQLWDQIKTEQALLDTRIRQRKELGSLMVLFPSFTKINQVYEASLEREALAYEQTVKGLDRRREALERDKELYQKIASGKMEIDDMTIKFTVKEQDAAQRNLDITDAQIEALDRQTQAYYALWEIKSKALDIDREEEFVRAFANMAERAIDTLADWAGQWSKLQIGIQKDKRKHFKDLDKQLRDRQINQTQYNRLALAGEKYFTAKTEYEESKFSASLVREIGQQIMAYAARKAAMSGNIFAAVAMLGAGVAALAITESKARAMEADAERRWETAQAKFEEVETGVETETAARKISGTIKAENITLTISPTILIQGEQIFIGQGSITEFGAELQALLLTQMQDAVDNRELDLGNIAQLGG